MIIEKELACGVQCAEGYVEACVEARAADTLEYKKILVLTYPILQNMSYEDSWVRSRTVQYLSFSRRSIHCLNVQAT